ncbi:hypothetical protein LZ31DRAFT_297562 [Colletotrichum somersetense]|nr:hypothetical protein LZ31DRAFT_297562 [Colletotrichum somersetense]
MLLLLLLLLPNLLPASPLLSYRLSTRLLDFALALASTESLLIPTSSQLRPFLVCFGTGSKQALTGRANLVCPWSNRRFREVHPDPCTSSILTEPVPPILPSAFPTSHRRVFAETKTNV